MRLPLIFFSCSRSSVSLAAPHRSIGRSPRFWRWDLLGCGGARTRKPPSSKGEPAPYFPERDCAPLGHIWLYYQFVKLCWKARLPRLGEAFVTFLQHGPGKRAMGPKFGIFEFEAGADASMLPNVNGSFPVASRTDGVTCWGTSAKRPMFAETGRGALNTFDSARVSGRRYRF